MFYASQTPTAPKTPANVNRLPNRWWVFYTLHIVGVALQSRRNSIHSRLYAILLNIIRISIVVSF